MRQANNIKGGGSLDLCNIPLLTICKLYKHVICEINNECIINEWALLTVSRENGFVNHHFQQLTLILGFCIPKNGNNGFIPKNYCLLEQL